jgi:membrane-associated phospholipid phosphatase
VTGLKRFAPIDVATLIYVTATTVAVLLFGHADHAGTAWLLTAHVLVVGVVLLAPYARRAGSVGRFVGDWYPILMVTALYSEIGVLNLDFGHHHDFAIQRLEQWVFGSQVSYRWIRAMPNPALSWLLHTCYLAYYAIVVGAPFGLWLSGRRDGARLTIFAVMTTLYVCYLISLVFPVVGPRYAFPLAHNAATKVLPARAAQWLLNVADSWGAAFPSGHVAGALVAAVCALRFWRPLGLALAPLTVGLVVGVVYGQFHYAVDALAGIVVAAAVLASLNGGMWWDRAAAPQPAAELGSSPLRL